ncbi:hypothetical protein K435DRAFT_784857 [Dendrothele bispora CBS 962.96]|uniref:Uncharacterized protein n=1 Tax=Dendrothele bispora (strain CBS 962.96) TaxID=1314807 RepID=A0A4S8L0U6_DENBC|nr:hypothetical protein K435DRAFT_784857 [Dendrothele bispora CBS 962.96]
MSTDGFDQLFMPERVLVTPEYKAALLDAKRWFSGGKVLRTNAEDGPLSVSGDDDDDDGEMGPPEEEVTWPTTNREPHRHIFIVTGTPGVGKSLFLYYILVERLLAGLPTCFQTVPDFFTFWSEEGVFQIPLEARRLDHVQVAIPADAWFLVDSNEKYPTPDGILKDIDACVVQAAPTRSEHLRWTEKCNRMHFHWCIKSSPLNESLIMRRLNRPDITDEQWKRFFDTYGPSTRLLTSHAINPDKFEAELRSKLRVMEFNTHKLRVFLFAPPSVSRMTKEESEVSALIFGINPGSLRLQLLSTFHTPTTLRIIKEEYQTQWIPQVQWAYDDFKANPQRDPSARSIVEDRVHDVLMNGGCWKMVKLSSDSKGKKNNVYRIHDARPTRWLVIDSTGLRIDSYETREVKNLTGALELHWFWDIRFESKPGYYRPLNSIQSTSDAYIVNPLENSVFVIQTMLAGKHDAKQGSLEDLRVKYSGFVFYYIVVVGEQEVEITMPQEADEMWESRWCIQADEAMLLPKQVS